MTDIGWGTIEYIPPSGLQKAMKKKMNCEGGQKNLNFSILIMELPAMSLNLVNLQTAIPGQIFQFDKSIGVFDFNQS